MKYRLCLTLAAAAGVSAHAAAPLISIVERGPHHRKVQQVSERLTADLRPVSITNSYTELATGMYFRDEQGNWVESKSLIELFPPDAAVARHGPMQVIFPANARTAGGLDVSVDGKRLRSHVIGIAYAEADTGRAVMVAELQDSIGQVVGDNELWYPDALVGEIRADIQYVYNIHGLEQNIVIRESIDPSAYGLNPATVRVQVFTEWVEAPEPAKQTVVLKRTADPVQRAQMADPDLVEERLQFGSVIMPAGVAFPLHEAAEPVMTGKTWEVRDGRRVLVEQTDFSDIRGYLNRLPQAAAIRTKPAELMAKVQPGRRMALPAAPPREARVKGNIETRQMAALTERGKGFVLDYQLLNTDTNDFTFRGDTTYFISASVSFSGTTTFEGGTVIKCTNGVLNKRMWLKGPVDCRTSAYRPGIVTGKNDDTVGEIVAGSTGNPATNHFGIYIDLSDNTNSIDLHDLHVRYARYGFQLNSVSDLTLRHSQIGYSHAGIVNNGLIRLRNLLIHDSEYAIGAGTTADKNRYENVTFHRINVLRSSGSASLTNCLLIAVTNGLTYIGTNNQVSSSETGIFQTAGYGARYLATNGYRNAGTTNINPALLSALRERTTYPPILISNSITVNTTVTQQVQRDTDVPDLGYHYLPVDWLLMGGITVTGATLTVTGGAVIGMDAAATNYGLRLDSGASFISDGTPLTLNRLVRTHSVQEVPSGPGYLTTPLLTDVYPPPATAPTIRLRFTDLPTIAGGILFSQQHSNGTFGSIVIKDSQVRGGSIYLSPATTNQVMAWTNSLFERVVATIHPYPPTVFSVQNCLFKDGSLSLSNFSAAGTVWSFRYNQFDRTIISQSTNGTIDHGWNAYLSGFNRLTPHPGTDLIVTNVSYERGPLGDYYQPPGSWLIDRTSTYASSVGLYHYGTVIGLAETNGILDIGLHYIVLNAQGEPEDSNTPTNGIPNYIEDADGDGIVDAGETPFTTVIVSLTTPPNSAELDAGSSTNLMATATAAFSPITWVEFYNGTNLLGQDTAPPYSFMWNNLPAGIHTLTARARADAGVFGTSAPVTIRVNNALFVAGSTNLTQTEMDMKGRLESQGLYPLVKDDEAAGSADAVGRRLVVISRSAETNLVGTKFNTNAVPLLTWGENLYGWLGMTTNESDYRGTLNDKQNQVLLPSHKIPDGLSGTNDVTSVNRDLGWAKPKTNAARVTRFVGTNFTNHIGIFGYESNAPMVGLKAPARRAGFFLGAAAISDLTSNGLRLLDRTIEWAVNTNAPPLISWIAPTNGSTFNGSEDIELSAEASDNDSTLRRVSFYRDDVRIGIANAPTANTHSMVWSNIPGGTHRLSAKAVDQGSLISTSSQFIAITVRSNILFIAGLGALNAADAAISNRLANRGYVVTVRNGASATPADAEGKSAILISATANASQVTTNFTKGSVPIIVWNSALFYDLGMAGTNATESGPITGQSSVAITTPGDLMAAGLSGTNSVATVSSDFTWAVPGSNAVVVATVTNDVSKAVIWRYDKGKLMVGLGTNALAAPGRRVGFFFEPNTAADLNASGWALFDAALDWAMAKPCFPKLDVMLVVDVSGSVATEAFAELQMAASNFVQKLRVHADRVGLVSFAEAAILEQRLTTNFALIVSNVYALADRSLTHIETGINTAQAELDSTNHASDAVPVMILFSDGGQSSGTNWNQSRTNVIVAADNAKAKGTRLITVRYDGSPDQELMPFIPSPGDYYYSPDTAELTDLYTAIADTLCLVEQPPWVSITNPVNNAIFVTPVNITINATAFDTDGFVASVEFFRDGTSLGIGTSVPYSAAWNSVPAGIYALTAVARDNANLYTTSAPVSIIVNSLPTVSITTPTNDTAFNLLPTNVTITASASDDRSVTNVEFFANGILLAVDPMPPYSIVWENIPSGTYSLTARATDDYGAMATSAVVSITVANPPPMVWLINPTNGVTLLATSHITVMAAATDPGGSVTNVEFFNGTSSLGYRATLPYALPWDNIGPGYYALTAVASDNSGLRTTSAVANISVISPLSRTWTRNVDFAEGHMVNLNYDDVPDQLQLNKTTAVYPYVYVACSDRPNTAAPGGPGTAAEGTVVRIDANTGEILGEYRTAPDGRAGDPSRTTVDRFGNVWVANRGESEGTNGSVTRIGLVIGGTRGYPTNSGFFAHPAGQYLAPPFAYNTCIDRDGDGYIRTSRGVGNVLAWTNANHVDSQGGVSSAEDEAIINYIRVKPTAARTIAVDANNDIWVGGYYASENVVHEKVDTVLGLPIASSRFQTNAGGYGGLIDGYGVLWSARGGGDAFNPARNLLRFDPATNNIQNLGYEGGNYGLGVDPVTGTIWHSDYDGGNLYRRSANGTVTGSFRGTYSGKPKGVVVDTRGRVWMALGEAPGTTVEQFRTDGTYVGAVVLPCVNHITGVAVDLNGKIWASALSGKAFRINPDAGPVMLGNDLNTNGFPVGAVDLTVDLGASAGPYNYSDFTGFVTLSTTAPSGIWTVIHDSGTAGTQWGTVKWSPTNQPAYTGIKVEVRAAASETLLTNAFRTVTNDVSFFGTVTGRYFQVRVTLTNAFGGTGIPFLEDLTVASGTNAPVIATNAPYLANDDGFEIWQDSTNNVFEVLRNDSDPAGHKLGIWKVSAPRYGSFSNAITNIVYTPNSNFFGRDRFIYTVTNSHGGIGRGLVTVTTSKLEKTNEPPVAVDDLASVKANSGRPGNIDNVIDVLTNDLRAARIVFAGQGRHGSTRLNAGDTNCVGQITYTPKIGFVGTDSFVYAIINSQGAARSATVNVRVIGDKIRPIQCGEVLAGELSANDAYLLGTDTDHRTGDLYSFAGPAGMYVFAKVQANRNLSFQPSVAIVSASGIALSGNQLPTTGTYFLEVLANGPGPYEVELQCTNNVSEPQFGFLYGSAIFSNNWTIDFGVVLTNTEAARLTTVYNGGFFTDLGITNVVVSGPFSIDESYAYPLVLRYDPSVFQFADFTVRFNPLTVGLQTGSLIFTNNDPDENPFVINLRGWGSAGGEPLNVSILSPTDNTQFADPRDIFIDVYATTTSGSITQVLVFITNAYNRVTFRDTNSPYQFLWTAPEDGAFTMFAQAYDSLGRATNSTNVTVLVGTNIANHAPIAEDDYFVVSANSVSNKLYALANDSDPDGDPLTIVTNASVIGVMTNTGTYFVYTPPTNSIGTNIFTYQITDGRRAAAIGKVTLIVSAPKVPAVEITSPTNEAPFTLPATVSIQATASDADGSVAKVEFYVNGELWSTDTSSPYTAMWTEATAGWHRLQAVATDSDGYATVSAPVDIQVKGKPGNQLPIARLSNLSNTVTTLQGGLFVTNYPTLREGLFTVTGTADDPDGADTVNYKLLVKAIDARAPASAGIESPVLWSIASQARVNSNTLGTLDLSMLRNGIYDLELRVYDGSDTRSTSRRFILDSELKIGHFSFSEQDLVIPVNGIPLTVTRTYNSLNANVGDFGHSWTYALNDMEVELDEERDWNVDVTGEVFEQRVGGGRNVTLTLPDGRRATFIFDFQAGGEDCPGCFHGIWKAPLGVTATLSTLFPSTDPDQAGDNTLQTVLGFPYWHEAGYYTPMEAYDFSGFKLTMQDGTKYEIERPLTDPNGFFSIDEEGSDQFVMPRGKAKVKRIVQRTGDRIEISTSQITHLNATGAVTRTVWIQRDEFNRIKAINDPISGSSGVPVVKYTYDEKGNLAEVARMVDRSLQTYFTNRYSYTNVAFPHYLTGIEDARGIQVAKNLYDEAGRLIAIVDADGRTNRFHHDLIGRTETITNRLDDRTIHAYDTRGNVVQTINALAYNTYRGYDNTNNLIWEANHLNQTNWFFYDENRFLIATHNPLGHTNGTVYNTNGQVLISFDALGRGTTNTYDAKGNLTHTTNALGIVTTFVYDDKSQLIAQIDALGTKTTNTYDSLGFLTSVVVRNAAIRC